jgi:pyrroline-5-carboxylate reductase
MSHEAAQPALALIGAGNMGEALLRGLIRERLHLIVAETNAAKRAGITQRYGRQVEVVSTAGN